METLPLNRRPIGIFDSGMGGLTVLAALHKLLPNEHFIYLGDTARVPYGSRSPRTIQRYSTEVARHLMHFDVKMMVIACNTATAHAETLLRETLPVPVLGVIRPGVEALASRTKNRKVGVIGTRSTIKSDAYGRAIRTLMPDLKVFSKATPLFVPLVEEGWIHKKITSLVIEEYLSELIREDVDAIILGCTHYPLLKESIQAEFPGLELIDSSVETARSVQRMLEQNDSLNDSGEEGSIRILLTDVTDQMLALEKLFLGLPFQAVEEIRLTED